MKGLKSLVEKLRRICLAIWDYCAATQTWNPEEERAEIIPKEKHQ